MSEQNENVIRLPLWKACLEEMHETGFTYGAKWKAEFFEQRLRAKRDTPQFQFEMMELKRVIEDEDGYYLRSSESGATWDIPEAIGHEDVAKTFGQKHRRYLVRAIGIRSATLHNPKAILAEADRKKMEKGLERDAIRLVLTSRVSSIASYVKKNAPHLIN